MFSSGSTFLFAEIKNRKGRAKFNDKNKPCLRNFWFSLKGVRHETIGSLLFQQLLLCSSGLKFSRAASTLMSPAGPHE